MSSDEILACKERMKMSSDEILACKDCKYYAKDWFDPPHCTHNNAATNRRVDLINGKVYYSYYLIRYMRDEGNERCGIVAKYWEPKDEKSSKKNLWKLLRRNT